MQYLLSAIKHCKFPNLNLPWQAQDCRTVQFMNSIYKLKYSNKLNQLIAVSELATQATGASRRTTTINDSTMRSQPELADGFAVFKNQVAPTGKAGKVVGSLIALSGMLASSHALALSNAAPQVVSGSADIQVHGSTTQIVTAPSTILNWQNFNIKENEIVDFIQQSAQDAVLNRVVGTQVSEILGTLKSNGHVFLINPNGIIFGKHAVVDTQSLVASTLNLSDEDFKAGQHLFTQEKDKTIASVLNQGLLKVKTDGSLALIGGNVANNGVLEARNGNVYLLAGQSIHIADFNNPQISFKVQAGNSAINLGAVMAANVNMLGHQVAVGNNPNTPSMFTELYRQAATNANQSRIDATGTVELYGASVADTMQSTTQSNDQVVGERSSVVFVNGELSVANPTGQAGNIKALGDNVLLGDQAVLDATGNQGGNINVGGDIQGSGKVKLASLLHTSGSSKIDVSATEDAGNAIFWGEVAKVNGNFTATSVTGQGGFIETSGKSLQTAPDIKVDTRSQAGADHTGLWLLDPEMVLISKDGSNVEAQHLPDSNNFILIGDPTSSNQGSMDTISNATLNEKLKSTNVKVSAYHSIHLEDVTIEGSNDLTLEYRDLYVNRSKVAVNNLTLLYTEATSDTRTLYTVSSQATFLSSTVNLEGDLVSNHDKAATIFNQSNISARNIDLKVTHFNAANSNFSVNGSNFNVAVSGNKGIVLKDSNISGGNTVINFTTTSNMGQVQVSGTNISSSSNLTFNANGALELHHLNVSVANVSLNTDVTSNITNTLLKNERLTLQAAQDLNITSSQITASKALSVVSSNKTVTITESNVTSDSGKATIKGGETVTVVKSNVTTTKDIELQSATGTNVTESKFQAGTKASLKSTSGFVNLTTTSVSTNEEVRLLADAGSVNLDNATITANKEAVITTKQHLSLTKSKISTKGDLTANMETGKTTLVDSSLEVANNATFKAKSDISIAGTNLTANNSLSIVGQAVTNITHSNITGKTKNYISTAKELTLENSKLASESDVSVSAYSTTKLTNLNISSNKDLDILITGDTIITDSQLSSTKSSYLSNNGKLSFTGSSLTGAQHASISANEIATLSNSNLSAGTGTATVKSQKDLSLSNVNISSKNDVEVIAPSLAISKVTIDATNNVATKSTNATTVTETAINAGNSVNLTSTASSVKLANATVTAQAGSATLEAATDVTVSDKAKLTSQAGTAALVATNNIQVDNNANITGANLLAHAKTGSLNVANATTSATTGSATLAASAKVNLSNASASASTEMVLGSVNDAVTISNTNLTTTTGRLNLIADTELTVVNATVTGASLKSGSRTATTQVSDSSIVATGGDAIFNAGSQLNLSNTTTASTGNSEFLANSSIVISNGTRVASKNDVKFVSVTSDATLTDASLTAGNKVDLRLQGNLQASDSSISAKETTGVAQNNLVLTNTVAQGNKVTFAARNDTTIANSSLIGSEAVTIDSGNSNNLSKVLVSTSSDLNLINQEQSQVTSNTQGSHVTSSDESHPLILSDSNTHNMVATASETEVSLPSGNTDLDTITTDKNSVTNSASNNSVDSSTDSNYAGISETVVLSTEGTTTSASANAASSSNHAVNGLVTNSLGKTNSAATDPSSATSKGSALGTSSEISNSVANRPNYSMGSISSSTSGSSLVTNAASQNLGTGRVAIISRNSGTSVNDVAIYAGATTNLEAKHATLDLEHVTVSSGTTIVTAGTAVSLATTNLGGNNELYVKAPTVAVTDTSINYNNDVFVNAAKGIALNGNEVTSTSGKLIFDTTGDIQVNRSSLKADDVIYFASPVGNAIFDNSKVTSNKFVKVDVLKPEYFIDNNSQWHTTKYYPVIEAFAPKLSSRTASYESLSNNVFYAELLTLLDVKNKDAKTIDPALYNNFSLTTAGSITKLIKDTLAANKNDACQQANLNKLFDKYNVPTNYRTQVAIDRLMSYYQIPATEVLATLTCDVQAANN